MCEPVSIGIGVAAVVAGTGMLSSRAAAEAGRQNQNAQNRVFNDNRDVAVKQAEERRARENRTIELSNKAYARKIERAEEKITQLKSSTAEDALTARAQYIEARGDVMAAAGSAGGGGLSIQDQMRSFAFKQGRAVAIRDRNLRIQISAVTDQMEDFHAEAVSNADQITPAPFLANGLIEAAQPDQNLSDLNSIVGGITAGLGAGRAVGTVTPKPINTSQGLQLGPGTFT